ncbi:MAG: hypothetical protein QM572_05235 [Nocardioides sp.]|uniref:hypothetical protein n=1 Tax=Nocardioides sp. TaxID=35761 RepID=UPI0039E6CD1B
MDQKARRAAVAKAFRARKVGLRRGHWRVAGEEVVWWIDLRSDSPRPTAELVFEVGAWVEGAGPEPEGGAIDCPLLLDVPLGEAPGQEAEALLDRLEGLGTLAELKGADLTGAFLDASIRALLGR